MRSIGEAVGLFFYFFVIRYRFFKEERKVKKAFYSDTSFKKCDQLLLSHYLFSNPYHMVKKHYLSLGEKNPHQYGETPLTALEKIAKECHLTERETLFELGCGRGRGVFFLAHLLKCKVRGIEWIPEFVLIANEVKRSAAVLNADFSCQDMLETDLREATAIYLYGTCLEEAFIFQLVSSLLQLRKGTKLITVSYPLTSYTDLDLFQLEKSFKVPFPWGEGEVFLHYRV